MNPSAVLRSERLRPLTRLAAAWGVWAALGLATANPLRAQSTGGSMTPAGTVVENEATVTYQTQNGTEISSSGSVSFTVGQVAGVDIDPPRIAISEAGRDVVFSHDVINVGNGADAFDVIANSPSGWATQLFHDVDGDQRLTAADTLLTTALPVPFGGREPVLVVVTVPLSATQGTIEAITATAISAFDGATTDAVIDEVRLIDAGIDPQITKAVDRDQAAPDDLLTFTIGVRLDGAGARDSVFFEDKIPAFAQYEAGTLQWDGQTLTDQADTDAGVFDPGTGTLRVDLTSLPADTDATILLQLRVDDDAPVGAQVVNRGQLFVYTPAGVLEEESAPAATTVAAPQLELTKTVEGLDPATTGDTLTYTITVTNPSAALAATSLTVIDTLPAPLELASASPAPIQNGAVLQWTIDRIEPGQAIDLRIVTTIPEITDTTAIVNTAYLIRDGATGEAAASGARTLMPGLDASLDLDLQAEVVEVGIGEALPLQATVTNDGQATVADMLVKLALPEGTQFIREATLTGSFTADRPTPALITEADGARLELPADFVESPLQIDSFAVEGDTLRVWVPGELRPLESLRFRYRLMVNSAPDGVLLNEAIAQARRGTLSATSTIAVASNQAQAIVGLTRNRALETRTVIGKVYHDIDGDGFQDEDEPGVPRVDIITADGQIVTTDSFGKFSLNNLRPGRHALRVDPLSVPEGLTLRTRGIGQRMQVVEVNGWNSPRASFALDGDAGAIESTVDPTLEASDADDAGGASETAGTELGLRAPGADVRAEKPESIRVEALRSDEDREADAGSAFLHGPSIRILDPVDGLVAPTNRVYIGVEGEPMKSATLYRNEEVVEEITLLPNGVGDFVGVELQPGPQTFRVQTVNSWGNERWDAIQVHQSGPVAGVVREDDRVTVSADGRTPTTTRVRLLDAWGVPVVNRPFVTVELDEATFLGADVDPSSVGHQLAADPTGWVEVAFVGGRTTGESTLRVMAPDAGASIDVQTFAPVRPLFVTGVGQLSIGSGGEDFGAITAQGRLTDETALTLSYDTRKLDQGRDVFGLNFDPLEEGQQPILGDASSQRSLSSSRYQFSARVERGLDWFMFGDVQTSGFSDGLSLARYGRSLPGAAARVTTGNVVWNAFGASTTQALQQLQLRGEGSSGPYELGPGVLPGTEEVRVEVRALENPTRILSEKRLTRFAEYQIDYQRGILLLKQPIPAADPFGNPMFLVVTYEGESGGDRSPVFGVRASSDLPVSLGPVADEVPVTMSYVYDDQPGRTFQLGAFQTGVRRDDGLEVSAEVAVASGSDSTGVATKVRAQAPLMDGRAQLQAEWSRVGDEFANPANIALRPGTEELRASADVQVGEGRATAAYEKQNFSERDLERSRATVGYAQNVREDVAVEARLAADATSGSGQDNSSGAGEYKVTYSATDRLDLFAEGRNELWSNGNGLANRGAYVGGGATFQLTEAFGVQARHLRVSPAGDANPYGLTSFGLTSQLREGTKAWGQYEITGGIDGERNAAIVGLNHRFRIGSDWRFNTMIERRNGVAGATLGDPVLASPFDQPEGNYTSASFGTEYLPENKPYRASLRAENRDGNLSSTRLATVAGDIAFNAGLGLLSRSEFVERDVFGSLTTRYTRERSTLWGLAYRPTQRDDLNILFKFGWKDAINPFGSGVLATEGDESRLIAAMEAIWTPRADVELGARFATRSTQLGTPLTDATTIITRNQTDFVGVRGRWYANEWIGGELEARGLMSALAPGAIWDVAPSVVVSPYEALELEVGYRFGDLQDPDFAVKSGEGFFLTIGTRVTEDLISSAADFWRERFGG
ncbi:MAG: hypothetical protein AAF389_17325 [Gemmatimonadota bacterium]